MGRGKFVRNRKQENREEELRLFRYSVGIAHINFHETQTIMISAEKTSTLRLPVFSEFIVVLSGPVLLLTLNYQAIIINWCKQRKRVKYFHLALQKFRHDMSMSRTSQNFQKLNNNNKYTRK